MDLLLDTHVCVWWAAEPTRLSDATRAAIADASNAVWASSVSAWELAIKVHRGALTLDVRRLFGELAHHGVGLLGIGIDDAVAAGALDWAHCDPFDRMLAAQAVRSGRVLVTADAALRRYLGDGSIEA